MDFIKRLFGKKTTPNIPDSKIEENKEKTTVGFKVKTLMIGDSPFELMLNMELLDPKSRGDFNWMWNVTIQSFDNDEIGQPTESERKVLLECMQNIIQTVLKETEVKIVGTSLHKGLYDIMFYARKSDTAKVGGTVAEMPYELEDVKGRFVRYNGTEDATWETVRPYYEVVSQG